MYPKKEKISFVVPAKGKVSLGMGEPLMEFRQLEYFCTISDLENFTRTAQVLHVSQPSVTKAIKALESELQLTLIDRSQKHIALTEEGKAFLVHAQRIMQDVEAARQDMRRFHNEAGGGTIHFGIPPMIEAYLFPDFFTKFRQEHPDVFLDVQEFPDSLEVRERAEIGELDFGIVLGSDGESGAHEMLILQDSMSLCVSMNHPLAMEKEVGFHQLREEKFIMQQPNTYQYRRVFDCCAEAGFAPDIVLCTSQIKTIKQLVTNEMGISILPNFVMRADTTFSRRPLAPPMDVPVYLYWGAHKQLSQIDSRFMDFMRKYTESADFKQYFRQG